MVWQLLCRAMTGSTVTDRNLFSPENLRNPIPLYKELRESDPVHFVEPMQSWFITRYDDVMEGFRDPRLSSTRTSPGSSWGPSAIRCS
jgi:cytochrome P450